MLLIICSALAAFVAGGGEVVPILVSSMPSSTVARRCCSPSPSFQAADVYQVSGHATGPVPARGVLPPAGHWCLPCSPFCAPQQGIGAGRTRCLDWRLVCPQPDRPVPVASSWSIPTGAPLDEHPVAWNGAPSSSAAAPPPAELIHDLEAQADNDIRICGIFDDRSNDRSPPVVAGYPKLGNISALVEFARLARIDMLIVCIPLAGRAARAANCLKKLWILPVDIRLSAHTDKVRFRNRGASLHRHRALCRRGRQADRRLGHGRQADLRPGLCNRCRSSPSSR